ncbi:uncharacterized protein LOC121239960 [Juglans microcarpa x Juglans regia]|uniref:uncharacterized protein LOC121239960 n=1 Tax=Juglans microcarpa x Juglans regia TaxID=2249226 RepID=UPI001B7F139D|nr:uncharacterized protein LOC121239960 [Juglans microcarpa x Juglans regia]
MALIIRKLFQCRSFPRTVLEDTAFVAANSERIESPPLAYTSLKDLLPRQPPPRGLSMQSVHEIPISNFLVQRAAWAYLQPTPVSGTSSSCGYRCIFSRVWEELRPPVNACIRFFNRNVMTAITQALDRVVGVIHDVGGGGHDHADMY